MAPGRRPLRWFPNQKTSAQKSTAEINQQLAKPYQSVTEKPLSQQNQPKILGTQRRAPAQLSRLVHHQ
jgi:hypothetical protein